MNEQLKLVKVNSIWLFATAFTFIASQQWYEMWLSDMQTCHEKFKIPNTAFCKKVQQSFISFTRFGSTNALQLLVGKTFLF